MEAKLYGQNKGGMSINGIIKDYYAYAGENVSAGDLVEYVNGVAGKTDYGESTDTQLSTNSYTGYAISAVQLDENRVFVAHSYGSNHHLYGMVAKTEGNIITCGDDILLKPDDYSKNTAECISACLLADGRVFIAHNYGTSYSLYAALCEIDDMEVIPVVKEKQIRAVQNAGASISTCLLPNGNVFIAHSCDSNYYLCGIVVSVDGTTITAGTDTALVSTSNTGHTISTCLLPNGNVFIAHSYQPNLYLNGMIVSIDGTTITKGKDTYLSSGNRSGNSISAVLLDNGNVFIAHSYSTNFYLYGMVCSIDGTTITAGTDTVLSNSFPNIAYDCISATALSNGKVFIAHSYGRDTANAFAYLYGIICDISGTTITAGTDTALISKQYAGFEISSLLLDNGSVFVAHSNTGAFYYLNAQIWGVDEANNIPTNHIIATKYETQVRQVTTGQFDGIAKTSGTGGDDTVHKDIVSIWTKE